MWKYKLEEIKQEKEIYEELINDGATASQIEKFKTNVKNRYQYDVPEEFLQFLKIVDGLEFNGFIIYGIDDFILSCNTNQEITGFISSNDIWYENEAQKQYIFLGESNISWYCFDLLNAKFVELDNPSGTLVTKYSNFKIMLGNLLGKSLL